MKTLSHSLIETQKVKRVITLVLLLTLLVSLTAITVYAATTNTDVAGAVKGAYNTYVQPQIVTLVNDVILPIVDGILAVVCLIFLVMSGVQYKTHPGSSFQWQVPAAIFCGLIVSLSAPLWIWNMIGWKK